MNDLAKVCRELNVPGSSPNDEYSQVMRPEIEVQKVTSTMKIEMEEKLFEAKEEIEVMYKKLSKAKEDT
ncbi:hypothetical protein KY290_024924 [Solanum tuberosum]|uniref:Uncharacterized protein n=1 Tax=Solanum tuberosum TaxID=4113 RepID=A0ABQ7USA9_SOLTU|nr:hypothetical protein KY284_023781 [Solanum tuberosum]KAH0754654.1 hypothetical protein KY290_024924 [Solanum tuberosum]